MRPGSSTASRRACWARKTSFPQEKFPNLALVKTYNTNAQTPDSAPTASANEHGVKSKFGSINVSENATTGDCSTTAGNELKTFAEIVSENGKSVGVITTARLTHATPACGLRQDRRPRLGGQFLPAGRPAPRRISPTSSSTR